MPRWKQGAACGLAGRGRARSLMFGSWTMVWACQIPPICLFRSLRPNRAAPALDSYLAVRLPKHTAANSLWRTAPTRGAAKRDCDYRFSGSFRAGPIRTMEISLARSHVAEKRDGFGSTRLLAADSQPLNRAGSLASQLFSQNP